MSIGTCFVMQPFDRAKFDKRFADVFEPALRECGFDVYRVDRDPGVTIPIDDIERGIRESRICFAEITTDNPNVWFELGYAIACGKEVVMVCSNERSTAFPFDVRHRNIIHYDTDSMSSYNALKQRIIDRTKALLKKQKTNTPVTYTGGIIDSKGPILSDHEVSALIAVMADSIESSEGLSAFLLRKEMQAIGYTAIAASIAIKKLITKSMVEETTLNNYNGEPYLAYFITRMGEDWVLNNEDKIALKYPVSELPF